jgi:hypothetical protein
VTLRAVADDADFETLDEVGIDVLSVVNSSH